MAGADFAEAGRDAPAGAVARQAGGAALAGQRDRIAPPHRRQQAAVEQGRMQLARGLEHQAAVIVVAADLGALLIFGDQPAAGGAAADQLGVAGLQVGIVRGGAGAEETAALLEVAVDVFGRDQGPQSVVGGDRRAHDLAHQLGRIGQCLAGEALADAQPRTHAAAAAGAGARAEVAGLQYGARDAGVGQRAGRRQAGIAAAHDHDIGLERQRRRDDGLRAEGLPPVRLLTEAARQNGRAHRSVSLSSCMYVPGL